MVNEGRDLLEDWMNEFRAENGGVDGVILVCGTHSKVNATTKELAKKYFSSKQGIEQVAILDGRERPEENAKHEQ